MFVAAAELPLRLYSSGMVSIAQRQYVSIEVSVVKPTESGAEGGSPWSRRFLLLEMTQRTKFGVPFGVIDKSKEVE